MTLETRKPSGQPSWPIILLAGVEGSGKSWTAAEASGMPIIGRSFWLEVGESSADEYGNVPGADYEIVVHDGSFRQILGAARAAGEVPVVDGKPNLLIVDSVTEVWELLCAEQQALANKKRGTRDVDSTITMDQWNAAKKRWQQFVGSLRSFPGPVILTSRLDSVTVLNAAGTPTKESTWKIRAEKNLPYEVQVIAQARTPREWLITKIRSTKLIMPESGSVPWPSFTIADLLAKMELGAAAGSTYVAPDSDAVLGEGPAADAARAELLALCEANGIDPRDAAARFSEQGHGDLRGSTDVDAIRALIVAFTPAEPGADPQPVAA